MYFSHQRVLLLLISAASAAIIPPPTDVNVSCHDLQTVVTWKFSEQQPGSFRVKVSGSEGHNETVTQGRHYDLSHFLLQSVDHLLGFHFVSLTAIQGSHESEAVTSQTFTFNDLKTADLKCRLDFPPVNLTVDGEDARVRFPNPLHWYKDLGTFTGDFDFTVTTVGDGAASNGRCAAREEVCSLGVLLRESEEQRCVRLKGSMELGVGKVSFTETQLICYQETTDVHALTLALLLSLLAGVMAVLIFGICKLKAWMMKSPPFPDHLDPKPSNSGRQVMDVKEDVVSRAELIGDILASNEPYSSLIVDSEEDEDSGQGRQVCDRRPPALTYVECELSESSDEELEAVGLIPTQREDAAEGDSSDDSQKTDVLVLEEEDEDDEVVGSGYDCPHRLEDMGD